MTETQSSGTQPVPWYLWAFGAIAILWNGMGVFLWGGTTFSPETFLKDMPPVHREYVGGLPFWSTITWGLGVLGGTAGAILLLLRNARAEAAFALSSIGAVTNTMVYVTNPPPPGFFNLGLTLFIIGFALLSFWFAHRMKQRGVL